ncbi:hypothetical protein PIB30_075641 [Stylosanthes scabra]|uniref:Uncharacterized protein n=1 Tax=Stylosanthes scabra TaxID=79078 RepID=A0ABU6WNA7_9FABA|nr:hypothetical protein [Stylosanthes scabra]
MDITIHLYRNGFKPGYWVWTEHGEVDTNGVNRPDLKADRILRRSRARAATNVIMEDVNWESNHDRYNEMIFDTFGVDEEENEMSDVVKLMYDTPWLCYSKVPSEVKDRWFDKWMQDGMPLHNFLKDFPYNRFLFPNFTLSNSHVQSKMLSN